MKRLKIGLFFIVGVIALSLVASGYSDRDTFTPATQAPMFALIAATFASIQLLPARVNNSFLNISLRVASVVSGFLAAIYWLDSEDANLPQLLLAIFLAFVSVVCLFIVPYLLARQSGEGEKGK